MILEQQYNILWATSWIAIYPTFHAIKKEKYDLALATGIVFLTSINYWRDPSQNKNRLIDIMTVRSVLLFQLYKSFLLNNKNYMLLVPAGVSSYLMGCHFYQKKQYWLATYFHMGLHIIGNIGNFMLIDH
mgnify:FL=1|tara:strand:+ start:171 stop:560 length:390 start_codon:yes stop_codon:yes gene_type:complete